MGNRGRPSHASLSVVSNGQIDAIQRPRPPEELNHEQAVVWREIVDRLPADWFQRENYPLLVQYCRHVSRARMISEAIEAAQTEFDGATLAKLLGAEEVQSRALASLATRMRLSQQSSYDPSKRKGNPFQAVQGKPWSQD